MRLTYQLCLLSFLVALQSCRPATPPKDQRSTGARPAELEEPLRLQPFHLRVTRDAPGSERIAIDGYDADMLFSRGTAAYEKGDYATAKAIYEQLSSEFPNADAAPPALYNSALCREHLADFPGAIRAYSQIVEKYPRSRDVNDALFRMAGAYESLEAFDKVEETLNVLLFNREDLEGIERIEALARKGATLIRLDKRDEARLVLKEAVLLFKSGRDIAASASTYYYAMAQLKLGEIIEADMHDVVLTADEKRLEPALQKKCQLLLDAQNEYTRTIAIADPHHAAAAAYRIGHLYRVLWDDMLAAPPPADLNEEERGIYVEVLKKRIRVLLKKAVLQWERVLKMADRIDLDGEWVTLTKKELEEVRTILVLDHEEPFKEPGGPR